MSNETAARGRKSGHLAWVDHRLAAVVAGSVLVVVLAGLVQVANGAYTMPLGTTWNAVADPAVWTDPDVLAKFLLGDGLARDLGFDPDAVRALSDASAVVWSIRLPRVLVGVVVGANLAVSGAIFQAVTRNELASPYILGVSSGAGLAVLLTLVLFGSLQSLLPLFAALGGTAAFLLVYAIAWQNGTSPVRLVLAGVVVSMVFGSLQRGLFFFTDSVGVVQQALAWTTGSLTAVGWAQVRIALPWTLLTLPAAVLATRQLDVLLLGERTASSLGMSVERVRFAVSGLAIVAASTAIAVAGLVSFVGLVVPHVVRTLVGSDHRRLVVGCAFAGPALLVAADVGARLLLNPQQLPVGILTGLLGGPYFLYLMKTRTELGEL